ncbi:hypothetical protein B9G98_02692 [Wickerhamiella sorbophila]|uniref:SWIRM domain-containing protein n=1 Tax=Wickerhamiella sorbophila TaxID=45607 RepID=A0A2T0FJ95_9ASCO|nr:hypothetical protein B9G98_02692 [Wickerhamiella sorbophila]PRT55072.1 hypothetical protein B9G98_02692 [Wickerhamiella sorbophila]
MAISEVSFRMLSPPLSPYPDLASFNGPLKLRDSLPGPTDASRTLGTPETFSKESTPSASQCSIGEIEPRKRKMVTCWDAMLSSPAKFYKKERDYLSLYPVHRPSWSNYLYVEAAPETRIRRKPRQRVRRMLSEMELSGSDSVLTRSRAASAGVPVSGAEPSSDDDISAGTVSTPKSRAPKKRASTASPVRVHDLNLSQIDDYSPSVSTLPPGRSLRAEWKGAPMDLSQDPDVHLLHPAEVHLASVLRLPAEVYLDSKRRLFAEKVHRLRQGLPFRRTDSQKACRIDVNKASRLFGAFEKVGWLEDSLFSKYL